MSLAATVKLASLATVVALSTACGAAVATVDDGTYLALVPSQQQFGTEGSIEIPGGFRTLAEGAAEQITVTLAGSTVTFGVDGITTATRQISERRDVTDEQGSGPFKAKNEILLLGQGPLVVGELTIEKPVIWPGSYDIATVITIKEYDPLERGPEVSCGSNEVCLLLWDGSDPTGLYENANNPALGESPIESLRIDERLIEFDLTSGALFRIDRAETSTSRACGLAESSIWQLPEGVAPAISDPVLIHTLCPTSPGEPIQLVIMSRSEIPTLVPRTSADDGAWCEASLTCLWFAPI